MTEQEAEALAARLTSVWAGQDTRIVEPFVFVKEVTHDDGIEEALIRATIEGTWGQVQVFVNAGGVRFYAVSQGYWLFVDCEGNLTRSHYAQSRSRKKQAAQERFELSWLGIFRRTVWLLGSGIEASAYEKAEWIQGFSREELQAWNLNL